jgi:hypothetical protein
MVLRKSCRGLLLPVIDGSVSGLMSMYRLPTKGYLSLFRFQNG